MNYYLINISFVLVILKTACILNINYNKFSILKVLKIRLLFFSLIFLMNRKSCFTFLQNRILTCFSVHQDMVTVKHPYMKIIQGKNSKKKKNS